MTKLQATQLWALFAKKNRIYSAVRMRFTQVFFRSPPSLATKDLVLERVVLIHRPACTHKTQKGNRRMLEENLFVVATCT